jgi:hypothetical protein
MRKPFQLCLGFFPLRDVLMRPGDAPNRAFRTIHRGCRNPDMHQRPILTLPQYFFVANNLAIPGTAIHLEGFPLALGGHDLNRRADRFRSAISVELLCCGIPENDPAFEIGTDDAYRRCIDDRGKRVFGLLQFELPPFYRRRHAVECLGEVAGLVVCLHRGSVGKIAARERECIALQLLQRPNNAARQHPRDRDPCQERKTAEDPTQGQVSHHRGLAGIGWKSNRHHPRMRCALADPVMRLTRSGQGVIADLGQHRGHVV